MVSFVADRGLVSGLGPSGRTETVIPSLGFRFSNSTRFSHPQRSARSRHGHSFHRLVSGAAMTDTPGADYVPGWQKSWTPAYEITYNPEPRYVCHHETSIWVDAPASKCFPLWNNWMSLMDFIALIDQVYFFSEEDNPSEARLMCFYRWGHYPALEIQIDLFKTDVDENKHIQFESHFDDGMPMKGIVTFNEQDGGTTVELRFEHLLPEFYVAYGIGKFAVETSMQDILQICMDQFKQLVEGKAEPVENLDLNTEEIKKMKELWANRQDMFPGQAAMRVKGLLREEEEVKDMEEEVKDGVEEVEQLEAGDLGFDLDDD